MADEISCELVVVPVPHDALGMGAYLARPVKPGRYPTVIVGMELFGVTPHIKDITERVAKLGYVAIAPDFYHRVAAGTDLPYDQEGRTKGFELLHQVSRTDAIQDVRAAMDFMGAREDVSGRTGFLGFSLGGHIAYLAATQLDIAACACFYGGWIVNTDIEMSRPEPTVGLTPGIARHDGKLVYFVGGQDFLIPREQREQLRKALAAAHVLHEIVVYPEAKHGFFCDVRDNFHQESRDDAWLCVQELFAQELRIH